MLHSTLVRAGLLAGVSVAIIAASPNCPAAASVPDVDRVVLIVGQNVDSVTNYIAAGDGCPGGIMSYTSTANAEGLGSPASYGSGLIYAQYFTGNPAFNNTVLQLGLYIDNDLANIVAGLRDANIATIANWIRNAGRTVYVRIGYEFDGPWNALPPDQYIAAYHYIVDHIRAMGVTNAACVWHSCCAPTWGGYPISAWYPGDNYVDWAGISVFEQFSGTLGTVSDIDSFCAFAKSHNKPIMIAESTPYGGITAATWNGWFLPCLDLIHRHHIQIWCYINTDWDVLPLFSGQGWGDSRIEMNPFIQSNWLATVCAPVFLKQSSELFPRLHDNATNCWREAESGALNGTSVYADAAASGDAGVTGMNAPGRSIVLINDGPAMQFVLRYAAANAGTLGLYVNSQPRRTLPIAASGGANVYRDLLVHAAIPAGANVKFQFDNGDTAVNLDSVLFRGYADTDGDGLPDDWERWRLGTLGYGPNDDPDHDGSSNYAEWVADTDPLDPNSNLRVGPLTVSAGAITVPVCSSGTRDCFLEEFTDLKNWTLLPTPAQSNAPSFLNNAPAGRMFFRVKVP